MKLLKPIFLNFISCMTLQSSAAVPDDCKGFLFTYFEGSGDKDLQEHLRFALSDDGVNWYALNSLA